MLDSDRGKLCFTVRCNGKPDCRGGRTLPTIDPEEIAQFLKNTGFVELPHRGWVCPDCFRALETDAQPEAAPAVGSVVLIDIYRDRQIGVLKSKTGFDTTLGGRPLMHSFETAEEAMGAVYWRK